MIRRICVTIYVCVYCNIHNTICILIIEIEIDIHEPISECVCDDVCVYYYYESFFIIDDCVYMVVCVCGVYI